MTAEPLTEFLDRLASGEPVPGGGGAAALTAAASAALISMVCRVAAARSSAPETFVQTRQEADDLRRLLVGAIEDDARAFTALLEARRGMGQERAGAVREALRRATEVPVAIARASGRLLSLCDRIAAGVRPSTVADLAVASALAAAALDGVAIIARVNLRDIDDALFADPVRDTLHRLARESTALRQRMSQTVAARTGVSA